MSVYGTGIKGVPILMMLLKIKQAWYGELWSGPERFGMVW